MNIEEILSKIAGFEIEDVEFNDEYLRIDSSIICCIREFPECCAAVVLCDFDFWCIDNLTGKKAINFYVTAIEEYIKDILRKNITLFATQTAKSRRDNAILRKIFGSPFYRKRNPNTSNLINYYKKTV